MSVRSNDSWFVAQLKPHGLTMATVNLKRQGLRAFTPKMRHTIRKGQRFVETETPVFPGYTFVQTHNIAAHHRQINNTRGVTRLVAPSAGTAPAVPTAFIDALLAQCDGQDIFHPTDDLPTGSRVEVVSGPFAQLIGEIQTLEPDGRIRVMLDVLGQNTKVTLDRAAVRHSSRISTTLPKLETLP